MRVPPCWAHPPGRSPSHPVAQQTPAVPGRDLGSKPADQHAARNTIFYSVPAGVGRRVSSDADFLPAHHSHAYLLVPHAYSLARPAASVALVPGAASGQSLPAMRDLEEGLSAGRPQCALTIAAIAVSFSPQYFFLIFRADSCVARYPLQLRYINAMQHHG